MVGPIRSGGIASGINPKGIIKKLLKSEQRPIQRINSEIEQVKNKKSTFSSISSELSSLKSIAQNLSQTRIFDKTSVSSSNPSILSASGNSVDSTGSFSFTPKQTSQTHFMTSSGFSSKDTQPGAGDISLEVGDGFLDKATSLRLFNNNQGVDRGTLRIRNDGTGEETEIDLTDAVTAKDVVERVNADTTIDVKLEAVGDRFLVENETGNNVTIETAGSGTTASDLGIAFSNQGGNQLVGDRVLKISPSTRLERLNDGLGVRRNPAQDDFNIHTGDGTDIAINLDENQETIQDVIDAINTDTQNDTDGDGTPENVRASFSSDTNSIVLEDLTGNGDVLSVDALNGSNAAVDLGFLVNPNGALDSNGDGSIDPEDGGVRDTSGDENRLVGKRLIGGINSHLRRTVNGGVRKFDSQGNLVNDFDSVEGGDATIQARDGTSTTVNFDARNSTHIVDDTDGGDGNTNADPGDTSVELNSVDGVAVGDRIRFSDGNTEEVKVVTDVDRGNNIVTFSGQPLENSFTGDANPANADGVHTDKQSLKDVFHAVDKNGTLNGKVQLETDSDRNGVLLKDTTGSTANNLVFDENTAGTIGTDLDVNTGGGGVSSDQVDGSDRERQHIGRRTKLSSLNGGEGVDKGSIIVEDRDGTSFSVDLTQEDDIRIGDVITEINNAAAANSSDLRAEINSTGDGIVLNDSTGTGKIKVQEDGGTTAEDLNILGEAPDSDPGTLDGSFEFQVDVTSSDTLQDIVEKINQSGADVKANLIDDGTGTNPFRISLESQRSGLAGRMTVTSSVPDLDFNTTSRAQNARFLFGSDGGSGDQALFVRNKNTLKDAVDGLTVEAQSESDSSVSVNINEDFEQVNKKVQEFVDQYNKVIDKIKEATKFNPDNFESGPLLGNSRINSTERQLAQSITTRVLGINDNDINVASEIGIEVQENGKLNLNSGELSNKLNTRPEEVKQFFVRQERLDLDTELSSLNNGRGVDEGNGDDIKFFAENGEVFSVNVSGADDISELQFDINTDANNGGRIDFSVGSQNRRFTVESLTGPMNKSADGGTGGTTLVENDLTGMDVTKESLVGASVENPANGEVATVEDFDGSDTLTLSEDIGLADGDTFELQAQVGARSTEGVRTASTLGLDDRTDPGESLLEGNIMNLDSDPGFAAREVNNISSIIREPDGAIAQETDRLGEQVDDLEEEIEEQEEKIQSKRERLIKRFSRLEQFIFQQQSFRKQLQGLGGGGGGGGGGGLSQLLGGL